ncbi:MAG: endonuclease/exonuclease/phosphatase family protein, partial [Clostridia bacterium]|nr:endonuclease/exonuclease/phosphatase family protein [Clostridia bacterium]
DGTNLPVVLMGDFNVKPDDPWLEKISERLKSAAAARNNYEFTWSTYNPNRQIDYIFVPKTAEVLSYEVHKFRISDHRPVTAEIEL